MIEFSVYLREEKKVGLSLAFAFAFAPAFALPCCFATFVATVPDSFGVLLVCVVICTLGRLFGYVVDSHSLMDFIITFFPMDDLSASYNI